MYMYVCMYVYIHIYMYISLSAPTVLEMPLINGVATEAHT